jgi:phosphoribosylformylglycinamidine cyclo-ligase
MSSVTYRDAGVDIDAGGDLVRRIGPAVESTRRPEVLSGVGGFASLVRLPSGYREPLLVSGTDGVGTKLKIAFELDEHRSVGIDLVAMCANDVLAIGAEPLFFLDYYACGRLEPRAAAAVVEGIAEGCRRAGCALVGGETAELPGFYREDEYDLAGFVVGVVERDGVIDGSRAAAGDAVIGISSSGLHSNGYSLARRVVEISGAGLGDTPDGLDRPLGEVLLEPTRIYARPVRALMERVEVRSLAHITGGGLVDNVPRTLPERLAVRLRAGWPVPAVFRWLARSGPVEPDEMLRTFNMGIGMTVVVPRDEVDEALRMLREHDADAHELGEVVEVADGEPRVLVEGDV